MKIFFCALGIYLRRGGMERFNQQVVRCLSELRSTLITSATVLVLWDSRRNNQKVAPGVRFVGCGCHKISMFIRFVGRVLRERPDVILYGHILLTPLAVIARFLVPKTSHILFVHGIEVWARPAPLWREVVRRFIQRIVSVSRFTAGKMQQAYGLESGRFEILPNAIDLGEEDEVGCRGGLGLDGEHRLLTVSRLTLADKYKNHDKVIRTLQSILPVFPDTHYYIVGDGALKEELRALAERVRVAANVHFLGYLDDDTLEHVYESCHVFVMPSTGEGFGIVFLEAWKHKLPVIASTQDASGDLIEHNVNGLLVNPDNTEEIAHAILSLLSDPQRRAQLGQAGFHTLRGKYTHEHFRKRFAELLA